MSTQNFSVTAGTAKYEDFTKGDAATTDKLIAAVFVNGAIKLTKKSASNGGSSDEIAIVAATKYTLKLSGKDTLQLPGSGVTYKLFKIVGDTVTELFTGAVTVSGAVESSGIIAGGADSYSYIQRSMTENGKLDVDLPANAYIEKIITRNVGGWGITIDIGSSSTGDDIVSAANTVTPEVQSLSILKSVFSLDSATELWVSSANWDGGELDVIVVWKVMND